MSLKADKPLKLAGKVINIERFIERSTGCRRKKKKVFFLCISQQRTGTVLRSAFNSEHSPSQRRKNAEAVVYTVENKSPVFKSCRKSVKGIKKKKEIPEELAEEVKYPKLFSRRLRLNGVQPSPFLPPSLSSSITSPSLLQSHFSFHTGSFSGRVLVPLSPLTHVTLEAFKWFVCLCVCERESPPSRYFMRRCRNNN